MENARDRGWTFDPAQLNDRHIVRRMVLKRCVYGVAKNPMAVELAKVSLWLHTFTVGAPLSFLDHHLRCGDSLFGARVEPVIWRTDEQSSLGSEPARCAFLLQDVSETEDPDRCFPLSAAVNPNTGTAPIFRSRRDAKLATANLRPSAGAGGPLVGRDGEGVAGKVHADVRPTTPTSSARAPSWRKRSAPGRPAARRPSEALPPSSGTPTGASTCAPSWMRSTSTCTASLTGMTYGTSTRPFPSSNARREPPMGLPVSGSMSRVDQRARRRQPLTRKSICGQVMSMKQERRGFAGAEALLGALLVMAEIVGGSTLPAAL